MSSFEMPSHSSNASICCPFSPLRPFDIHHVPNSINILHEFVVLNTVLHPFSPQSPLLTGASPPRVNDWVTLVPLVIVRHENLVRGVNVVTEGEETDAPAALR